MLTIGSHSRQGDRSFITIPEFFLEINPCPGHRIREKPKEQVCRGFRRLAIDHWERFLRP